METQYQQALNNGFTYSTIHPVKKPGAYQMRVALRDGTSEEVGSASQFIEAPDIARGGFTLTSLILHEIVPPAAAPAPDGEGPEPSVSGNPAIRVFKPGEDILYGYQVLNAAADAISAPRWKRKRAYSAMAHSFMRASRFHSTPRGKPIRNA